MYVAGAFQHSPKLELAIAELEEIGIAPTAILALPLDKGHQEHRAVDSMRHTDGVSYSELAAVLGMIGMLLGSIYGFVLAWGPILWGLIGLVSGLLLGYGISYAYHKRSRKRAAGKNSLTEVFLLIRCPEWQADAVKNIMWENGVLGVSDYRPNDGHGAMQEASSP